MSSAVHSNNHTSTEESAPFTDTERNALRTFLQRSEVRLSTIHRAGLAFIGGAGLLLLVPVFFKDVVDGILQVLLSHAGNQFPHVPGTGGLALTALLYITILYPLALSFIIPMYAVYLLLKDIVHFYFTIYMPGFDHNVLNPTFALSGLTFWSDESPRIKHAIMRYQYHNDNMDYMLPFSEERRKKYFDDMIENTDGEIIPASRRMDKLIENNCLPPDANEKEVKRFNAAFGIVRSLDRTLVEDVALTEMSLTRHLLYLRRLLLRYVKTLLMFIWTTIVSFIMLPFLRDERMPTFLFLALGYLVWSLAVMRIMHLPISWIYRHRNGEHDDSHIDPQLYLLENGVVRYCNFAIFMSLAALVLSVISFARYL